MRSFYKFLVVLIIVGLGLAVAFMLIHTRPKATRKPVSVGPPPVEVMEACIQDRHITVNAMGTVIPAREVVLQPEVSGTIVWQSEQLAPGAHLDRGAPMLKIDRRDYELSLEQQKAAVAKAQVSLKTERGRRAVAEREWKILGSQVETTDEGRELALRIPQEEDALASLKSAESALEKAALNLERTEIRAPFNALVLDEFVDRGQFVGPGSKIATLVGTDEFWVQASIPLSDLSWIDIPGVNARKGSSVMVMQENGYYSVQREGTVTRLLGDVDPKGRMARIIITVQDPLNLHRDNSAEFPLLLGSYVRIEIQGQLAKGVCTIPRAALRDENRVWLLTDDDRLKFMKVNVVWTRQDIVFVRNGFTPGDRIITSRIPTPVEGMKLQLFTETPQGTGEPPPRPVTPGTGPSA